MNCNCETLSDLRGKSKEIMDLGEEIREYADLVLSKDDIFLKNALVQRLERSGFYMEDYASLFIKACEDGRVYSKINGMRLNADMTHLAAASEHMFERRLYPITYHCAGCDENLLGES